MKEPKSIRLTNAHRADIIESVMNQWEESNPCPKGASVLDLFKAMHRKYTKEVDTLPKEYQEYSKSIEASRRVSELISTSDSRVSSIIRSGNEACVVVLRAMTEGGSYTETCVTIPVEVAKELDMQCRTVNDSFSKTYNRFDYLKPYMHNEDSSHFNVFTARIPNDTGTLYLAHSNKCEIYLDYIQKGKDLHAWKKERDSVCNEFKDYLNQFNTTKQIRDGWPELEQYLPAHIADPEKVIQLPALARSRLNERLGI